MSGFSKDFWRSNASFLTSFVIHLVMILLMALCLFAVPGQQVISLTTRSEQALDTVAFDYSNEAAEVAFAEASEAIDENTLSEFEMDEFGEFEWQPDVTSSLEDSDWMNGLVEESEDTASQELVSAEFSPDLSDVGFFGIEPSGQRIVYVLDASISMGYSGYFGPRYQRAVNELMRSIDQLRPDQHFYVILFCFQTFEMNIGTPPGQFIPPTEENKERLVRWLENVQLGPGTDPRVSIVRALEMAPSCVFLLSDGEFNGEYFNNPPYRKRASAVSLARKHNESQCPIHTIGLEDKSNQKDLTRISEESGGRYRFVSGER